MASFLVPDEGDGVSTAPSTEVRTAAPGLGFPRLSGPPTTTLGWPGEDRVSRETSTATPPARAAVPTAAPVEQPRATDRTTRETATAAPAVGPREDPMDAPTQDDTEERAQI